MSHRQRHSVMELHSVRPLPPAAAAVAVLLLLITAPSSTSALPDRRTSENLHHVNSRGPYIGVVVPNSFELAPLLKVHRFQADSHLSHIDLGGRRFRVGSIHGVRVIVVLTGLAMLNAGTTTQRLLDHFPITSVIHYGIAGSASSSLNIGDVTIASSWAHTGLWYWQRYGQGPNDSLALESNGDYTRTVGNLRFADYNVNSGGDNLLNRIYYQPEEVFPVTGTPDVRQHYFFVNVSETLYDVASKLEGFNLTSCLNATACLSVKPSVVRGLKGSSSNIFLDNAAYRDVLSSKFGVSIVDMESAAVVLTCFAQDVPYIVIRSISDMAGGSARSNEATEFLDLAAENAVLVAVEFIRLYKLSKQA